MKKLENILNNKVVIFIIFFVFLTPYYFTTTSVTTTISNVLQLLFSAFFIIIYLVNRKVNKIFFPLIGYYLILLVSTIINDSGLVYYLYKVLIIIGFISFVDLVFTNNDNFLKTFSYYITIFNVINLISILINPNRNINMNVNRIYFLGYDNDFNLVLTMSCYILLMYQYKLKKSKNEKYNKIKYIFYINYIITIISAFLVQSATFKISTLMFVFCYIFFFATNFLPKTVFNYKVYLTLAYVIFIGLVFFNIQNNFGGLIGKMDRDITFTGRTEIWDKALEEIKKNEIIGTGYMNMNQRIENMDIYHAHSTYLNIVLESGIIGEIAYLFLFIYIGYRISKIKDKKIVSISSFAIFTYLIMTLFEVYIDILYFYLLLIIISGLSDNNKIMLIYRRKLNEKNFINQ